MVTHGQQQHEWLGRVTSLTDTLFSLCETHGTYPDDRIAQKMIKAVRDQLVSRLNQYEKDG